MNSVYDQLFVLDGNALYVTPIPLADLAGLQTELTGQYPHAVIRRIEGQACRTTIEFFHAVAPALDFPDPRVSWNILNERLFDLTWLPADAYLLLIDNADQLLADVHQSNLSILFDIFNTLNRYRPASGVAWSPRKLLFQCSPAALPSLLARLEAAQIEPVLLQTEDLR